MTFVWPSLWWIPQVLSFWFYRFQMERSFDLKVMDIVLVTIWRIQNQQWLKVATKATKSKTNSCPFLQKEISTQEQYCSTWSQHPTPATQHPPLWHLSTNRGAGFHGSQHQLQFQPFHRQMHSRNTLWRWTLNNFAREQQPTSRWNLKLDQILYFTAGS